MNREPFEHAPLVEAWLKEPIWLPESDTARIAQLVHRTPQQRRWWPASHRKGLGTMFSATRFVAAGVVIATFVGFLFASGTFSPQPVEPLPAVSAVPTAGPPESAPPSVAVSPSPDTTTAVDSAAWDAVVLPQGEKIAGLASGVAVGPDTLVAVGRRACERIDVQDIGRCWGQPWISTDGVAWEAVEARTSGLDLGRFSAVTSGPEVGVEGLAYGPGGFVAFGWAHGAGGGGFLTPALWRSADGRSWERVSLPESFDAGGRLMAPSLTTIARSEDGYLLGGTINGKPAPRAAIWSSPDGLAWTLAEGDEVFDVGAYIDTMETPATGGVSAIAVAPSDSAGPWHAIAVGSACPKAKPGAGPKGESARIYEWTTGQCRAQAWRSADGLAWERLDLPKGYFRAGSVATDGETAVVGVGGVRDSQEIISSANGIDWAANGGQAGRQVALAADSTGFHALVPRCLNEECRRRSLDLWSSVDGGVTWRLDQAQPTMPQGVQDFLDVDMADVGDRVVVTAGYWTAPGDGLASMALLSPPLNEPASAAPVAMEEPATASAPSEAAGSPAASAPADASTAQVITLPPADAAPLPDTVATPAGRIAYVTGSTDGPSSTNGSAGLAGRPTRDTPARIRLLDTDTGTDTLLAKGSEPDWSADGTGLAYTCDLEGDVTTASICTMDVAAEASERIVRRAWGPRWSPDGSRLAFSRSRIDMGDAWVRDLASGSTLPLPGADPVWSPDGSWLMVTTGSGVPYVTVVRPDGTDERVLGPGWNATWSPDGTRIASAWSDGEGTTVSAVDLATGEATPLLAVEGSILAMAWLPGDVLAIVDGGTDGGNLYAVDLADLAVRSLTSEITFLPGSELTVSPDGQWLAFGATGPGGGTDIYLASVDGGWRQLTTSGNASMPTWAP
jgi:Tol biopolymer transport system component